MTQQQTTQQPTQPQTIGHIICGLIEQLVHPKALPDIKTPAEIG
jgi:hypothetical protein